jgi:hypothetical protein
VTGALLFAIWVCVLVFHKYRWEWWHIIHQLKLTSRFSFQADSVAEIFRNGRNCFPPEVLHDADHIT